MSYTQQLEEANQQLEETINDLQKEVNHLKSKGVTWAITSDAAYLMLGNYSILKMDKSGAIKDTSLILKLVNAHVKNNLGNKTLRQMTIEADYLIYNGKPKQDE